jgi:hypothetical protein
MPKDSSVLQMCLEQCAFCLGRILHGRLTTMWMLLVALAKVLDSSL